MNNNDLKYYISKTAYNKFKDAGFDMSQFVVIKEVMFIKLFKIQ